MKIRELKDKHEDTAQEAQVKLPATVNNFLNVKVSIASALIKSLPVMPWDDRALQIHLYPLLY